MFYISKELAEIKCDVPVECELERAKVNFDPIYIEESLQKLGIRVKSIAENLNQFSSKMV